MGRPPGKKEYAIPALPPTVVADPTLTIILPDEFAKTETKITNLMLANIGAYVSEGLNEEEACLMANFDYETFKGIKARDLTVVSYIRKQFVKLKQKHLRIMQQNPSDKNSQWILEKVFPEEFGSSKKRDLDSPLNELAAIIKAIQHDPNTPIIIDAIARDAGSSFSEVATLPGVAEALG